MYSPFKAIRKADVLVALTEHDASSWRLHHQKKVIVVPNPVSYYTDKNVIKPKVKGRIITVGRLAEQKRLDRLIEAFALISDDYPEWFVDIFGDGSLRDVLEGLIRKNRLLGRVNIYPSIRNIMEEYQRSQFFVLSSDYEGFGLVLVEAMACGIPVVSTDCPHGPSDIIDDGNTGLLTKMDVKDMAKKMEWMITHDRDRVIMGEKAYEAAANFKIDVIMPKWEAIYGNEKA